MTIANSVTSGLEGRDTADYGKRVEPAAVRFERLLPGPIERVWSYLVDSEKRALWLAAGDMPAVGGEFDFTFHNGKLSADGAPPPPRYAAYDGVVTSHHKVLRCEPPRVLVITWGGSSEPPSEVSFELSAESDKVRLVLTHRRLPNSKQMLNVSGGWHTHLAFLEAHLAGQELPSFWGLFGGMEAEYRKMFGIEPDDPSADTGNA